ncbi:diguanylate cyclase [Paucibacter sp. DJ2R-2]|uniref:diguanylate cyclase n=1 Tax=Paucibacter sp. DJ2R-2 TaxID=2893558 RepID=UPI0021E414F4|nr:diguanylate cyclase [Paucibacter sp. DJ2R-2]MCV2423610.1 diguanylate cyclase [Paucibacter sp. DJ4R-1]MCV2441467.1 diguanylate cyclase [Paucibacter sp. DJ2R-2]
MKARAQPPAIPRLSPEQVDALNAEAFELRMSDTPRALQLAQQAHDLALAIDHPRGLAYALLRWSLCEFILGEPMAELQARLDRAHSLLEALGEVPGHLDALNLQALIRTRQGAYEQALLLHQRTLELARLHHVYQAEARALNNMALVHHALGQLPDALELLQHSLEVAARAGSITNQAYTLGQLGQVLQGIGEMELAVEHLQRSLRCARQSPDLARQATSALNLGALLSRLGQHAEARPHLEEALTLSRRTGNVSDLGQALLGLGQSCLAQGEADAALAAFEEARPLAQRMGDIPSLCSIELGLADLWRARNELAPAQGALERALGHASDGRISALAGRAHLALSELAELRGDPALALQHYKAHHACEQRLLGERSQQRLRGLFVRHQAQALSQELQAARQADQEKQALLTQLSAQADLLRQLSHEDALTGLANRRWLDLLLEQEFERAARFRHPLSLAMLDLDHFKDVNDRFGHAVGDAVLRQVGRLLRDHCRRADVVARYGGEEFTLLLVETTLPLASQLCDKLRQQIETFDWHKLHPDLQRITVSIGLAGNAEAHTPASLCALADAQLYSAKSAGRNCVRPSPAAAD